MRVSRPSTSSLILMAVACLAGAALVWVSGLGNESLVDRGAEQGVRRRVASGPRGAEAGDASVEDPRALEGEGGAAVLELDGLEAGRTSVTVARRAAAGKVIHRASLEVRDLSTGEPVPDAVLLSVSFDGAKLKESRDWRVAAPIQGDPIEGGAIELEIDLHPIDARDAVMLSMLDVVVTADGYAPATSSAVPFSSSEDGGAALPARVVSIERLGSVRLNVAGLDVAGLDVAGLDRAPGRVIMWFDSDARSKKPELAFGLPLTSPDPLTAPAGTSVVASRTGQGFLFEGVPPGPLSLAIAMEGIPVAIEPGLRLLPAEELFIALSLDRGELVRGLVTDLETGQGYAGVGVSVVPGRSGIPDWLDRLPYPKVVTAPDGSFELAGVLPGLIEVKLSTPDGAIHDRKIQVVEGNAARRHDLKVRGAATLVGRIIVPEGASLAGVQVLVTTADEGRDLHLRPGGRRRGKGLALQGRGGAGSDVVFDPATGTFRADRVPSARQLLVQAISPSSSLASALVRPLKREEIREGIELTLEARPPMRFRVEDGDGQSASSIEVAVRGRREGVGQPTPLTRAMGCDVREDGLFQFASPFGEVAALRLTRGEGNSMDFPWPAGGWDSPPTFVVPVLSAVGVEVLGDDGRAVAGARVLLEKLKDKKAAKERSERQGRLPNARTDAYGRAVVLLPPGEDEVLLRVFAKGYAPVRNFELSISRADDVEYQKIELERQELIEPATVTGRIVRGNGDALPSLRFDGLKGGTASVDGHQFTLKGVRPGRPKLIAHCRGFESVRLSLDAPLAPGEVRDIGEVVMRGATRVEVTVTGETGRVIKDARVRLVRVPPAKGGRAGLPKSIQFPDRSSGSGVFRRTEVPRATWRLVVNHKGYAQTNRAVSLRRATESFKVEMKRPK